MASIFKRNAKRLTESQLRREPYWIEYTDQNGKRRRAKGFTSLEATDRKARDLEERARKIRDGLIDPAAEKLAMHGQTPLDEHLDDFEASLENRESTLKHVRLTMTRIRTIVEAAELTSLHQIDCEVIENCLQEHRRKEDLGNRTYNHYLQAFDEFCRWLAKTNRLTLNPISSLARLNNDVDVRHRRRSLSPTEVTKLLESAWNSKQRVQSYNGQLRSLAYFVSYMTGLRQKEMASLTPKSFDLDADQPTVKIAAACSKRRREDTIPLHAELVAVLRPWLKRLKPTEFLFPRFARKKAWLMVKKDLERVGIPYETEAGIADFHAAGRASHITEMLRQGANMVQVMKQARHSDIRMTMRYFKADLNDQVTAIEKLPPPTHPGQHLVSIHCGGERPDVAADDSELQSNAQKERATNPNHAKRCDTRRQKKAGDGDVCRTSPEGWRRRESNPRPAIDSRPLLRV